MIEETEKEVEPSSSQDSQVTDAIATDQSEAEKAEPTEKSEEKVEKVEEHKSSSSAKSKKKKKKGKKKEEKESKKEVEASTPVAMATPPEPEVVEKTEEKPK